MRDGFAALDRQQSGKTQSLAETYYELLLPDMPYTVNREYVDRHTCRCGPDGHAAIKPQGRPWVCMLCDGLVPDDWRGDSQ